MDITKLNLKEKYLENLTNEEVSHISSVKKLIENVDNLFATYGTQIKSINFNMIFKDVNYTIGDKNKTTMFPMLIVDSTKGVFSEKELTNLAFNCLKHKGELLNFSNNIMNVKNGDSLKFQVSPNTNFIDNISKNLLNNLYNKLEFLILGSETEQTNQISTKKHKI